MGGGAGVEHRAAVLHVRHVVDGGLGEAKEAWRTEPVVEVLVPLVSEQPLEEHRALARLEPRDVGVAPETKPRVLGRDDDRIVAPCIHGEDGARQRVLRLRPLGVEGARVPPGARPHVRHRVDLGVGVGLLVGDEGAVRLLASVDAELEAGLPEHLVAAEEPEMHSRIARRLDVAPLAPRPVLVVPHGEKEPVVADELAPPVAVDAGGVARVVAVRLEETHERVLRVEDGVHGPVVAGLERAVVAHLERAGRPPVLARVVRIEASDRRRVRQLGRTK